MGALLIQIEYGYSDEETVEQIKENPYLQFFCGLPGYHYRKPFEASTMVRFRKRIKPEHIADINEKIIRNVERLKLETEKEASEAEKDTVADDDGKSQDNDDTLWTGGSSDGSKSDASKVGESPNSGTMIVDATFAPSRIKYPTDIDLLNTAREKLEKIIDTLHTPGTAKKPRTYRKHARTIFCW